MEAEGARQHKALSPFLPCTQLQCWLNEVNEVAKTISEPDGGTISITVIWCDWWKRIYKTGEQEFLVASRKKD